MQNKILLVAILFSCRLFSQEKPVPFLSFAIGDGAVIQSGIFIKKWEAVAEIKTNFTSNTKYGTAGLAIGHKLFNWITPTIGVGYWKNTDFQKYDQDPLGRNGFENKDGISMFYGLELRRTWWFVKCSYIKQSYITVGVKLHRKWEK